MNVRDFFYKTFPAIIAAVFMTGACAVFTLKYVSSNIVLPVIFDQDTSVNKTFFYLNFYLPFGISALCLYGCLYLKGTFIRGLCFIIGLVSAVISVYFFGDLLTISLCIYSAYIVMSVSAFSPPRNYLVAAFALLFFTLFIFSPAILGPVTGDMNISAGAGEYIVFGFYLVILGGSVAAIRFLAEKFANGEVTVAHLNDVSAKMLLINHRLQEYVKNSGEEIVKKERLRFTRDLHDSCGYVFTNIIAVSEAAMSFSSMEPKKIHDTFQLLQNQARQGLKQTRETLHMIRELEDSATKSIDTIFEMRSIFHEVTGIEIDIESGNMKHDYGPAVNTVLIRIVQEAFTNSIRHGQATRILIHFWEFPDSLNMTVTDNGSGALNVVKGIGMAGMEERLAAIGGTLETFSPEDGGFRLKVIIPLAAELLPTGESFHTAYGKIPDHKQETVWKN